MRVVLVVSLLVACSLAAPAPDKRFIGSISVLWHSVSHVFNQAKDQFNKLTDGLNSKGTMCTYYSSQSGDLDDAVVVNDQSAALGTHTCSQSGDLDDAVVVNDQSAALGTHTFNFDSVVNALIPMIHSDMTEGACHNVCVGSAATVLGPAAPLAGSVCGDVCKA
ncbi:hypothetical protein BaRGS_00024852 [Batillaria attramentaria]|uniref:Uncharacterized protein n=1 Tax=Batillaria attramentaria TaxID=370345 RepID=A0ABD0KA67_9CAEN